MSFDLHFFSLPVPFEPASLAAEAASRLSALVQRHGGPAAPDQYGFFFDLPNGGGHIEFYAGKTEGAMLAMRGLSDAQLAFAWDVMREMGWAILAPVDENKQVLLTAKPVDDLGMLSEMECEIVVRVAQDASDLSSVISEPFEAWAAWRDQIGAGGTH